MKKGFATKFFATIALGLTSLGAWAVMPEAGKVYRIANKAYSGYVIAAMGPSNPVGCSIENATNDSQLWLAEAASTSGALTFRSLGTGMYLRSSNAQSSAWSVAGASTNKNTHMVIGGSNGSYTIKASNGSGTYPFAHCDAQKSVVCWSTGAAASFWDFTEVSISQAEIDQKLAASEDLLGEQKNESKYQELLNKIFADASCTTLNSTFAAMSKEQIQNNADYKALPAALQQAVLKVKTGDWSEVDPKNADNAWDSEHAKKYRVQLYEPYSPGSEAAELAGIQAYTNMNNPTGIISDNGTTLYVMVEGLPEEGCTLYMNGAVGSGMFNVYTTGVELHNGLNVVPGWSDTAHQFIYYTVNTVTEYQADGRRHPSNYKVTEFPDVKIHIEGGSLNGFFDYTGDKLYEADTTEDFWYTANRARHEMYSLVGKYVILYLFLEDTPSNTDTTVKSSGLKSVLTPEKNNGMINGEARQPGYNCTYDLVEIMKTWDNMCQSERVMMGVNSAENIEEFNTRNYNCHFFDPIVGDTETIKGFKVAPQYSYHDYFNNRMMGITMQGNLFMNATSWRTAYNITTLDAILVQIPYDSGSLWGPAHEYGHMNQGPVKVAGTTEISNNCFSNVAVYYHNRSTSRAEAPRQQLECFNNGVTYLEYGIWGTTRMYFQLFEYYHAAKNNTKFYPRLYELLRNHPLQKSYYLNPRYDALQFVKMCCLAAEEDLTNFFESWGLFVPLQSYHIGDYSNFMATLTQEDVDAVKAEIKSWGFPENNQIMLIDDRPGAMTLDGSKERQSWWGFPKEDCGPLGGILDFRNKVQASGEMSFAINGLNVEVTMAEGASAGVGFIVFDENGTVLAFSNDYTFPINSKAAAALVGGTGKLVAIGADGKTVDVENSFLTSDAATRLAELRKLIETMRPELNYIDEELARVGWYMPHYAKPILEAIAAADELNADSDPNKVSEAYVSLIEAMNNLKSNTAAKVSFIPGSSYNIIHNNFSTRGLSVSSNGSKASNSAVNSQTRYDNEKNIWTFETVSTADNTYRLKNVSTGTYLGVAEKGEEIPMVKRASAGIYTMTENGQGTYTLTCNGDWNLGIQIMGNTMSGKIGFWGGDDVNSQWILRLHDTTAKGASQVALRQLVADAKAAFPLGGSVDIVGDNISISADNITSNAIYTGEKEEDRFTTFDVLLDGDVNTYFHSNYDNNAASTDGKQHNLRIDLGEGVSTSSFQLTWTNRTVTDNSPVSAPTKVRVEGSNDDSDWTLITTLTDMPEGSGETYLSPIISSETAYRYIRLVVTGTSSNSKYFVLSELTINHAQLKVTTNTAYPKVTEEIMLNVYNALNDAEAVLKLTNPTQSKCDAAYTPLRAAYEALMDALGMEAAPELKYEVSGIADINAEGAAKVEGIYDLQGRRLNKVGNKGVYIVNGEKVLVK